MTLVLVHPKLLPPSLSPTPSQGALNRDAMKVSPRAQGAISTQHQHRSFVLSSSKDSKGRLLGNIWDVHTHTHEYAYSRYRSSIDIVVPSMFLFNSVRKIYRRYVFICIYYYICVCACVCVRVCVCVRT